MIVDCHTHLNRYTPDLPASLEERHSLLHSVMDAHGIDYALVISSYDVNADRPATEDVVARIDGDPRTGLVAAATARMIETGDFAALRAVLESGRAKALKLYPGYVPISLGDRRTIPVYELAAEFGLPVMVHTGDTYERKAKVRFAHPLEVDDVAVDHRDVTFIMCHMGNPWFLEAAEVVYKNENVLGDVSGLTVGDFQPRYAAFARNKLNEAITFINDPTKLLFGTDWPISDVGSYLEFVHSLDATDEEMDGLLWRNANRVYKLGLDEERADDGRA